MVAGVFIFTVAGIFIALILGVTLPPILIAADCSQILQGMASGRFKLLFQAMFTCKEIPLEGEEEEEEEGEEGKEPGNHMPFMDFFASADPFPTSRRGRGIEPARARKQHGGSSRRGRQSRGRQAARRQRRRVDEDQAICSSGTCDLASCMMSVLML